MTALIKRLTNLQEAVLVMLIGLGLFVYSSIHGLLIVTSDMSRTWTYDLSEITSYDMLFLELASLGIIALILSKRDWKITDLNFRLSVRAFADAILILIIIAIVSAVVMTVLSLWSSSEREATGSIQYTSHKNYLLWAVVLIVNSVFEEFLYVGYLGKRLERSHPAVFILISSTVRTIIHLYQGFMAIIPHFIFGIIFASYYHRYKNLATLVIAHTIVNLGNVLATS